MPGNRFGVGELWDGIKQAVANAFNTVAQTFVGILKELQSLAQKHLPAISIILRIVTQIPQLLQGVSELVRAVSRSLEGAKNFIVKAVRDTLSNAQKAIVKSSTSLIRGAEKNLRSAFNAAIKPLPKNIQAGIKGIIKPPIDGLRNGIRDGFKQVSKLGGEVTKLKGSITGQITKAGGAITKSVQAVVNGLDKKILAVRESIFREISKAQGSISKVPGQVQKFTQAEFTRMGQRMTDATTEVKAVGKNFVVLRTGIEKQILEVQRIPQRVAEPITRTKTEIIAQLERQFSKSASAATKAASETVSGVSKTVGSSINSVGKDVGKIGPEVGKIGKDVGKMGRFVDDAARTLPALFKTVTAMVPIIEGITEQLQFEEIFARLERIERRIDDKIIPEIAGASVAAQSAQKLAFQIREQLSPQNTVGSGASQKVDLQPILDAIARIPRTDTNALSVTLAAAAAAAVTSAIAAKPIQAQVNTEAVANAVAAKIPKATPAPTPEAIANAVAAKVPKPATARDVAAEVQTKLQPALKKIDGKLPDNGIFRVDQTGIANAVQGKLAQGQAKTDGAILQVLKQVEGIKLSTGTQTQTITQAITAAKAPNNVATVEHFNQLLNLTNNHTTNQVSRIQNTVNNIKISVPPSPGVDLSPLETQLKDIGAALGVPQFKAGLSVTPNAKFIELGQQTANGSSSLTANSLPQLMMGLAAIPYVRQGLHRLGGQFDQSVMRPSAGKVQINDALSFQAWQFAQVDERLGMPSEIQMVGKTGAMQKQQFRNVQDTIEEINAVTVTSAQDLEVIERYLFALTQDMQKIMQIALQTREDVDVIIEDLGCKYTEIKKSHPTHINLTQGTPQSSLEKLFENGRVHYVGRKWADSADKNQKLERLSYDTQIAAMSNKFDFDKQNPELPLDKSRATGSQRSDETWRTFVNTMTEPPTGYVAPGNPIPEIKEITTGTPKEVPKPTNPAKKLGQ